LVLATDNTRMFFGMTVDASRIYFSASGAILSCAIGGCGGNPTLLVNGDAAVDGMATDGQSLFWANWWDGEVLTSSLTGAAQTTLLAGQDGVHWLAIDGSRFYATTSQEVLVGPLKGGGAATVLFGGGRLVRQIAVDANNVYWVDIGSGNCCNDGTIMETVKP
jgi:hypothetical protein